MRGYSPCAAEQVLSEPARLPIRSLRNLLSPCALPPIPILNSALWSVKSKQLWGKTRFSPPVFGRVPHIHSVVALTATHPDIANVPEGVSGKTIDSSPCASVFPEYHDPTRRTTHES